MTTARKLPLAMMAGVFMFTGLAIAGCDDEGPMEKAGKAADEAVQDTKRAVEDATD